MRPGLALSLLALVVVPLASLGAVAWKMGQDAEALERGRVEARLGSQLRAVELELDRVLASRRSDAAALVSRVPTDANGRRRLLRRTPWAGQSFVRGADGELVVPAPSESLSGRDRDFLRRTRQLWERRDLFAAPAEMGAAAREGWYVWFWENDLALLYWRRRDDGAVVGVELDRARLMADIIAALPHGSDPDARVVLSDARGRAVYQWGGYQPPQGAEPVVRRALRAPLGAWHLAHHVSPAGWAVAAGPGFALAFGSGIAALALSLLGLAVYFYRESTREMREAAARVSFVNQVSHELKTPLTNIRMYAELLARDLASATELDERAPKRLGVIVSESQRLSRLIGNVLTFARQQRGAIVPHAVPLQLDSVVRDVLEQFAPSLAEAGIAVETELETVRLRADPDLIGQIIANLLSNAEKYAPGFPLRIECGATADGGTVVVHDGGQGIAANARQRVFEPFERLNDSVTEGVTGSGIGLPLSRDLARAHGGDLVMESSARGARFVLTVKGS